MSSVAAPTRMQTWARFGLSGVANTLISISVYQAALLFTGHLPAYIIGYAAGIAVAYVLYARHVFQARRSMASLGAFTVFYIAAGVVGGLINTWLIDGQQVHARLAIVATILLMLPINFLGSRACLRVGQKA